MRRPQPFTLSSEALALLASLFFALFCNRQLWSAALAGRDPGQIRAWLFAA